MGPTTGNQALLKSHYRSVVQAFKIATLAFFSPHSTVFQSQCRGLVCDEPMLNLVLYILLAVHSGKKLFKIFIKYIYNISPSLDRCAFLV